MKIILAVLMVSGLAFSAVRTDFVSAKQDDVARRMIVVFREGSNDEARDEIVHRAGGEKIKNLNLIHGRLVRADQVTRNRLKADPAVLRVDEDLVIETFGKISAVKPVPTQSVPWGISRVNAPVVWEVNSADPVKVGIIDTGISNTHRDLVGNVKGGVNTISPFKSWNDDNGHGSHVAGIVAGINNTIGVVGVAPRADLYAIKVLNSKGSGYLSDIIEGLDWAITNKIQVVNMSLGSSAGNDSFHDAIIRANQAGVVVVAAAGNSGGAVSFPAAYPEVIAVSATDSNNFLAAFSSRGSEVDLAAPGVSIYSTYMGTGYTTLSGTSMAAPHVAGAAALVINSLTCDGKCSPREVQTKLQDSALELGTAGFDNLYGWGLVDAASASQ